MRQQRLQRDAGREQTWLDGGHGHLPFLKVLDPRLAQDEIAQERFCREAHAAAAITHENVVAVHSFEHNEEKELPFLVMQLVDGETLEALLARDGKVEPREIVRIGAQIAASLAAAHDKQIVHRDITTTPDVTRFHASPGRFDR